MSDYKVKVLFNDVEFKNLRLLCQLVNVDPKTFVHSATINTMNAVFAQIKQQQSAAQPAPGGDDEEKTVRPDTQATEQADNQASVSSGAPEQEDISGVRNGTEQSDDSVGSAE